MNNTEKKLDALIDALGFDVEESTTTNKLHRIFDGNQVVELPDHEIVTIDYKVTKKPFDILSDDYTDEVLRLHKTIQESNTYNKELYMDNCELKKNLANLKAVEPFVPLTIKSEAWCCIVQFVIDHAGDIEAGTNDFDKLRPILSFMSRDSR